MRAEKIVQQFFETHLGDIHDARRRVLGSLVWMAMLGSALSLSRLARALAQHEKPGHPQFRKSPNAAGFLPDLLRELRLLNTAHCPIDTWVSGSPRKRSEPGTAAVSDTPSGPGSARG
jgi:hypothetical protein